MSKVSVIIVSYNTRAHLADCLRSIDPVYETIVVDNASQDGSVQMVAEQFPHVRLVRNDRNLGYGPANNQGIDLASGELILCLNSDAIAEKGAIACLSMVFDDPSVMAAGGALVDDGGRVQPSCCSELTLWRTACEQFLLEKAFRRSRLFNGYWLTARLPQDQVSEVAQVMGACLMMRKGFRFSDEYFLYCEDTDLCREIRKTGRIVYVPTAKFTHALGASSSDRRGWAIAMYNRGKEIYFQRHHGLSAARTAFLLNRLGAWIRFVLNLTAAITTLGLNPKWRQGYRAAIYALLAPVDGPPLPEDAS